MSAYDVILNGNPDLRLVNACIHQLEEGKELLKKERDNADARSVWLQNQGIWAVTVGVASVVSLGPGLYTLHLNHASTTAMWVVGFVYAFLALIYIVMIIVLAGGSSKAQTDPDNLKEAAKTLGGLLASFRILKDQLEDEAARQAQDTSRLTGSDSAGLVDRCP